VTKVVERAITTAVLRTAIKAKLRSGTTSQAISSLISLYMPPEAHTERYDGGVRRLPVEMIAHRQRVAFLSALAELPSHHSFG
jgi:hypothetical protein